MLLMLLVVGGVSAVAVGVAAGVVAEVDDPCSEPMCGVYVVCGAVVVR